MTEQSQDTKKFCSPSGAQIRIALTSGHITIIGKEWTEVHKRFWPQALAKGCISEDMYDQVKNLDKPDKVVPDVTKVIDAIDIIVKEGDVEKFDGDKPNAVVLSAMVGFEVNEEMLNNAWDTYKTNNKVEPPPSEGGEGDGEQDFDINRVIKCIGKLVDGGNEEDFTSDGKPNATILTKMCGFEVSADARDQAWESYQANN